MMYDVDPQKHIDALSAELVKHGVTQPEWAAFVRTGVSKARVPVREDWWQVRAAAILRTVATRGPIGTQKLRVKFGSRQNRGKAPDKFKEASGKIIRTILQQLEEAHLIKQDARGAHKGRVATGKGYTLLSTAAKAVV